MIVRYFSIGRPISIIVTIVYVPYHGDHVLPVASRTVLWELDLGGGEGEVEG